MPLGMDIGDLLELERTLQGHGVHRATPQEESMLMLGHGFGHLRDRGILPEDRFNKFRQAADLGG
jgi:hypothetical protein